jgi:hypothetical protein
MKYIFSCFFCIAIFLNAGAQSLKASFSPTTVERQKTTGLSNRVIGTSDEHIYVEAFSLKGRQRSGRITLKMIKKSDLSVAREVLIYDRKNPEEKNLAIADYRFTKNRVLVYYYERKYKDTKSLFGRSFDLNLNPTGPVKNLYSLPNSREFKGIQFLRNYSDDNTRIMVGAEFPAKKGGSPYVDFKMLSDDFSVVNSGKFELPIKITSKGAQVSNSNYFLTNSGDIYFFTQVSVPKEERANLQKGEDAFYSTLSYVKTSTSSIQTLPIKFSGKNIFNTYWYNDGENLKGIGFYSDLEDDRTGDKVLGMFSARVDLKSFTLSGSEFRRFTKEEVIALSDLNTEKRRDRKKAEKITDDNASLDPSLQIELYRTDEAGNSYLFCSKMRNYSQTVCTRNSCVTYYYCNKQNNYVFKVDGAGKLVYSKKFPRNYTYNRWSVYDQRVFYNQGKFFMTFDTDTDRDSTQANMALSRSKRLSVTRNEKLEFLVVDTKTDQVERKFLDFNAPGTPRKKRLTINPLDLQDMGGEFYAVQNDYFVPTGTAILNTVLSVALFPIYTYLIRPGVRRSAMGSRTQYVRVFAN